MTLWPTSFVGRAVATTLLSLVAAQLIAAAAFTSFVLVPQSRRAAEVVAGSLASVMTLADSLPAAERSRLVAELDRSAMLEVWTGETPPIAEGPPPRLLERFFMQVLVEKLPAQRELEWRSDRSGRLWLHVAIGPDWYWMSVRSPPTLKPGLTVLLAMAATLALTLVAAVAAQRRIARPLGVLADHVRSFRPGAAPPALLDETGPDEVAALSRGYNALIERLRRADEERALMLAGVSHDIRTPLAKLRLALEMINGTDAELSASAGRQIAEIDRIVDQFLVFARGASAEAEVMTALDALAADLVAVRRADGVEVTLEQAEAGPVVVRAESLRRALSNLIDNAARHGRPPIRVSLAREDGRVVIAVEDAGDGLPEHRLAGIAEPFVRGETARGSPGAGLGLAIVAQTARAHGGDLTLTNLPGGGLRAEMGWRVA